ncbi:MAG: hypothetical protein MUE52_06140 [Tabrizicola sp.]|nr:hypothetical protein [Tabrizicola sp.]
MTKFVLPLIAAAILSAPGVVLAETYGGVLTGPKGGTVAYEGECMAGETGVTCTRKSLLTGPEGKTATRDMERIRSKDGVKTTFFTTGEGGRSVTTTRERIR